MTSKTKVESTLRGLLSSTKEAEACGSPVEIARQGTHPRSKKMRVGPHSECYIDTVPESVLFLIFEYFSGRDVLKRNHETKTLAPLFSHVSLLSKRFNGLVLEYCRKVPLVLFMNQYWTKRPIDPVSERNMLQSELRAVSFAVKKGFKLGWIHFEYGFSHSLGLLLEVLSKCDLSELYRLALYFVVSPKEETTPLDFTEDIVPKHLSQKDPKDLLEHFVEQSAELVKSMPNIKILTVNMSCKWHMPFLSELARGLVDLRMHGHCGRVLDSGYLKWGHIAPGLDILKVALERATNLKKLSISDCWFEHYICNEAITLKSMSLEELDISKTRVGIHRFDCPSLKKVDVYNCPTFTAVLEDAALSIEKLVVSQSFVLDAEKRRLEQLIPRMPLLHDLHVGLQHETLSITSKSLVLLTCDVYEGEDFRITSCICPNLEAFRTIFNFWLFDTDQFGSWFGTNLVEPVQPFDKEEMEYAKEELKSTPMLGNNLVYDAEDVPLRGFEVPDCCAYTFTRI